MNWVVIPVALVMISLVVIAHWYVWRRMVRDTTRPGSWPRRVGTVLVPLLPVVTASGLASERAGAPFKVQQLLTWPGFMWLPVLLYLLLALLVGELVRPLLLKALTRRAGAAEAAPEAAAERAATPEEETEREATVAALAQQVVAAEQGGSGVAVAAPEQTDDAAPPAAPDEPAGPDLSRRLFVARTVAIGAGAVAAGTVGYGAYGVLGKAPQVKRVTVPLAKLPRAVHGYRIAVVSDIHLSPTLGRAHAQRIVDTINRTSPDLITIVGDLVDGDVHDLGPAAMPLRDLRAKDGSFFVTGNHEYFSGAGQWVEFVRELGVHPLENERRELAGFDLAGVNDIGGESEGQGPDFGKALGDRDPKRTSVLMAHQPVVIHDAVKHNVDLQLSGHTHGGQMWPVNYVAELANPTVAGLEKYGDTQLYVTKGAGAWGPPVRVGVPSDITVVELASRAA
ncbi:metallophosphoesterase [Streptomyces sp. A7024]|uniref:Metallophosphoesterase n=1 Tax=Streptomyces coryli TaxID=1128680 RepID=A0A6G4U8S7_9ACTN|nr:metallophosphoesterase [Streptomyces coryli]NGN68639.1 metallophosphoesterase [Streptomyces coryli]